MLTPASKALEHESAIRETIEVRFSVDTGTATRPVRVSNWAEFASKRLLPGEANTNTDGLGWVWKRLQDSRGFGIPSMPKQH